MRRLLRILWIPIAFCALGARAVAEGLMDIVDECPPPWERRRR